jgi:uncharacterized protein YjiS (DUF1127 family)
MNGSFNLDRVVQSETAWGDRLVCQAIMSIGARLWSTMIRLRRTRRARAALAALDDRMLKDIGVSRSEIAWVAEQGDARELRRTRSLESCRRQSQRSDSSAPEPKEEAGTASTLIDLASIREARRTRATNSVVTPAKAGVHIPEASGYGPRLSPG